MNNCLLISDAAKEVKVESHVLRYWEEELHLPIKRNELGHRYYTEADVQRFKQIKSMKERGLQLKAIKMILKDGRLDLLPEGARLEGVMPESAKTESAKTESAKTESVKAEGAKTESVKSESTKTEGAKTESTKTESVKAEGAKTEDVKIESVKTESAKTEGAKTEDIKTEYATTEYIEMDDEVSCAVPTMAIDIVDRRQPVQGAKEAVMPQIAPLAADGVGMASETKEEKSRKLQWMLQEMIRQAMQENNAELCRELKESVIKELDYQFRMQEERDEARDKRLAERDEAYYKKMDELLRRKSRYKAERGEKRKQERDGGREGGLRESGLRESVLRKKVLGESDSEEIRERQQETAVKADKKKRHFF